MEENSGGESSRLSMFRSLEEVVVEVRKNFGIGETKALRVLEFEWS